MNAAAPSEPLDAPAPERGLVASIGAEALALGRVALELYSVFVRTLYYCFRGRREPGAVVAQMYEIGNRSVFFLTVVMGFLGMILVFQAGLQTRRVVPDLTMLGATYLELLVRDLAASIGCLMLATRVGAGIAAEIGSMVVTEQVDALRMSNVDPVDYLVVPRFLACLVMMIVLATVGVVVATGLGALTAYSSFSVNPSIFLDPSRVKMGDIATGLWKCLAYGAAIPIVSGYCGLGARGGSEGVGQATTRAVIGSSFAVIVLDFFISAIALFTLQGGH